MGRKHSEPEVVYVAELKSFAIERTYAPDDEFAQRLYLDKDFEFSAARGDDWRILCFEEQHEALTVRAAWVAGRESVYIEYM